MSRNSGPDPVPGEAMTGSKRVDPDAHTNPDASPPGPAENPGDRESDMANLDGTAGDVPNVGAAAGASNAGRTRTSGGDS